MRVRVVLAVALVLAAGGFVLDMSGRAPRMAGTDHTAPVGFVATVQGGQELCQPQMVLPSDAERLRLLIGTYGYAVPELFVRFVRPGGSVLTEGRLAAGARQGNLSIPVRYPHGPAAEGSLCIRVVGATKTLFAGDTFTPGPASEQVAGKPQPGRINVVYMRPGSESWWQVLPTLATRFGLGKGSLFGGWTLPLAAALLIGVWLAAIRLLARELA